MAGAKVNIHRERILDKDFGQTDYTPPTSWWIGLFSVSPTPTGGGTELSYTGYARIEIVNDPAEWDDSITGRRSNVNVVTFPANGGGATPIAVAFALFDAVTAGTMWRYGPVSPNLSIPPGKVPSFPANSLVITES